MEQTKAFGDYIATILAQQPTYTLEIPYEEGALEKFVAPQSGILTDEELEDFKQKYQEYVESDFTKRVKAGQLKKQELADDMAKVMVAIAERLEKVRERNKELMVWFTYRVDETGQIYVSWPISGYTPFRSDDIMADAKVKAAGLRLSKRTHIKEIKVVARGVNPDVYFAWL